MEEIKITVKSGGSTQIEVNGVKGSSCKDMTRDLEKLLGITVSDQNTNEFYEQPNTLTQNQYNGQ